MKNYSDETFVDKLSQQNFLTAQTIPVWTMPTRTLLLSFLLQLILFDQLECESEI